MIKNHINNNHIINLTNKFKNNLINNKIVKCKYHKDIIMWKIKILQYIKNWNNNKVYNNMCNKIKM